MSLAGNFHFMYGSWFLSDYEYKTEMGGIRGRSRDRDPEQKSAPSKQHSSPKKNRHHNPINNCIERMNRDKPQLLPGMTVIPRDFDIVLGRGSSCANHPGNMNFTRLIEAHAREYGTMQTKGEKSTLIQSIYERMLRFGQFLRDDEISGKKGICVVVDAHTAKSKIGHALRYRYGQLVEATSKQKASRGRARGQTRRARGYRRGPVELFSDKELESVLGYPGEYEYPPAAEVIEPLDY
eukprot:scaffold4286_cov92-Amphora_coffeaeformis.AAC.4